MAVKLEVMGMESMPLTADEDGHCIFGKTKCPVLLKVTIKVKK